MGFIFSRPNWLKNFIIILLTISFAYLFLDTQDSLAESPAIKGSIKIHRMGSYAISINYQTYERWTDNLIFKVHCRFDGGDFTFVSSSLHNIERGWHKTEIYIAEVMRKRYGSLRGYKIELYHNGLLIDTKNCF